MKRFLRKLTSLELEEQILNAGSLVAVIGVFLPWVGGEWLGGETVAYVGFRFYTGYLGIAILALHVFVLLITFVPLTGGPVLIRRQRREIVRLFATSQATVLILASLTVLARATLEFARMELRFGIYLSLIGSLVATLYAYLRYQEQRKRSVEELFHHPDTQPPEAEKSKRRIPVSPPPPPAPEPEEHKLTPLEK